MPKRRKFATHKGCGGVVGWDAWVDSDDKICGGPYDSSECMKCGTANPELEEVSEPWGLDKK